MERVPEPEIMDGAAQARAYAEADFDEANTMFVDRVPTSDVSWRVVDLGCGPGDIVLRLAGRTAWTFDAVDGSAAMLAHAASAVAKAELAERVRLVHGLLPDAPKDEGYDLVLSNSLLHHLPDPSALWTTIRRVGAPGAHVCVMDLARPPDAATVEALVARYSEGAPEVLVHDFRASLFAAFEPDEVRAQLREAGLDLVVETISDRHLFVSGRLPE